MSEHQTITELSVPSYYSPEKVGQVWNIPYQQRAEQAQRWSEVHQISPASSDQVKIALILIDVQNTFCIPGFELFVGGSSGSGAVEDNHRLCEFIYRYLGMITHITATMDTHTTMQIFHPIFLVDQAGEHPEPMTLISYEELEQGRWLFNPSVAHSLGIDEKFGQEYLIHYARELRDRKKYDLTIWPYHALLGSIGHALVPSVEEAIFFHTIARNSQPSIEIKGDNPLTEHYSALGPEIRSAPGGQVIAEKNRKFLQTVIDFDMVIIAGQAKSHCVAWTVADLLTDIQDYDADLTNKVYLLEDCTSPVVVPGTIDFSEPADEIFNRFAQAGMHIVRSSDPVQNWPRVKDLYS